MWFPYSHRRHAAALTDTPALVIHDLQVMYPGTRHAVLTGVDLCLNVGERVALIGQNGAGKSTLLKTVAGLLRPHAGDIRIYGLRVGGCHHRVAYLPQRGEIDWGFPITLRRLVMTGRYVHLGWLRRPGRRDETMVSAVLERVGLSALADRQIGALSGGQQQRALIGRALAQEADLLLLDEPFSAVDVANRAAMLETLNTLRDEGKTILMATHDFNRLHEEFDRVLGLEAGRITEVTHAVALS